jgi:hypothetical protein
LDWLIAIYTALFAPWTVLQLASLVAMSRSIFAERFMARVGEASLPYVKRVKLTLASDMLAGGALHITQVARSVLVTRRMRLSVGPSRRGSVMRRAKSSSSTTI